MKGNITIPDTHAARAYIGLQLQEFRKAKQLSQKNLAELIGISDTTISKIEAGKWAITVDMLALFAQHLGFTEIKIIE